MHLSEIPLVLMLVGLAAYATLGGADFGAGVWQLLSGRSERDREIREHAHHAMGPVWETNHVWLIFILVVCWTAYPKAFGSLMSTLAVPLFIAGIGIVLRGTAYALRAGTTTMREQQLIETVLGVASILTPFALGAAIGGIASGRVPVGNAQGDLVSSWLNSTSILVGIIAVVTAAHMAAVFLAADAVRLGRLDLAEAFRTRALSSGVAAGAVALGGLVVVRNDAEPLWDGLTSGAGLGAVLVSGAAGLATLWLVRRGRFEPARYSAAVSVAAIIAGWALAQRPTFLPGLTIDEAAAGRSTLIALLVSVVIGALLLVPSLALLFGLVLRGRFDSHLVETEIVAEGRTTVSTDAVPTKLVALAGGCLLIGAGLMIIVGTPWARAVGVVALFGFIVSGFAVVTQITRDEPPG
jgi:cytochrome bd ubiquinol oxidase subunit II